MYLSKKGFNSEYEGGSAFKVTGGIYVEAPGLGAMNIGNMKLTECKFEDGQEINVHIISQFLDGRSEGLVAATLRKENGVWNHYSDAYINTYKKGITDGDNIIAIDFLEVERIVNTLLFSNGINVNEDKLNIKISCLEYSSEQRLDISNSVDFGVDMGFANIELPSASLVDKTFSNFNEAYKVMVELAGEGMLDSVSIEQDGIKIAELEDLMSEPKMRVTTFGSIIDKLNKLYIKCKSLVGGSV